MALVIEYLSVMQNAWVPFRHELRFLFVASIAIFSPSTTRQRWHSVLLLLHELLNAFELTFPASILTCPWLIYTMGLNFTSPSEPQSRKLRPAWARIEYCRKKEGRGGGGV